MIEEINVDGGHTDEEHAAVAALADALKGHTVVDIKDNLPSSDPGWSDHGSITLIFDDGSQLECGGWGHDAWGPDISYKPCSETT